MMRVDYLVKNCLTRLSRQNRNNPKREYERLTLYLPVNNKANASYGIVDATSIINHVDKYLYVFKN